MPAITLGPARFDDARIRRHFGHHDRYSQPSPTGYWSFTCIRVPLDELYCPYDDPGVRNPENPAGLMGSVGLPATGYCGVRVIELARLIAHGLATGDADHANPALRTVLDYQAGGADYIAGQDQPFAVIPSQRSWAVREGIHRAVALVLLGSATVDALEFDSGVPWTGAF